MKKPRDRRLPKTCRTCGAVYFCKKGSKRASDWCDSCRFPKLTCLVCMKEFVLHARFVALGRGKYCTRACANSVIGLAPKKEKHWAWKGGITANQLEYRRSLREKNRERFCEYTRKRTLTKKGVGGSHTPEQWVEMKAKYRHTCLCCRKIEPEIKLSRDHIVPITKGGNDNIENIQPLCISCNASKKTKTINYTQT